MTLKVKAQCCFSVVHKNRATCLPLKSNYSMVVPVVSTKHDIKLFFPNPTKKKRKNNRFDRNLTTKFVLLKIS